MIMNKEELEGGWPQNPKWNRYTSNDFSNLKYQFPGAKEIKHSYSQAYQDMFVLSMLDGKMNGTYLELGACHPRCTNNTYILETQFAWTGVSFEIVEERSDYFNEQRNNLCIAADATTYDYSTLDLPKQVDYVQFDCDPAHVTLKCLKQVLLSNHRFSVITFETDVYANGTSTQMEQQQILNSLGYQLVAMNIKCEGAIFEDWWVDPTVVPEERWKPFVSHDPYGIDARDVILKRVHNGVKVGI